MMRRVLITLLWIASLSMVPIAHAHKASDSYLTLKVDGEKISGQWDIALRDLDLVLELDRNGDSVIDWGEVRTRHAEIDAYATQSLALKSGGSVCPLSVGDQLIDTHSDGAYVVLKLAATCPNAVEALTVNYRLLFEADALHRGLLRLETAAKGGSDSPHVVSAVFPAEHATQTFTLASGSTLAQLGTYIVDGVRHIAAGFDHILFLIVLLLPAVLVREGRRWVPVADMRTAFISVLKIVTAFTIAHSITLSLASLDVVRLPSRLVESLIAASVLATALDNIWPFLPRKRWLVAFSFGLIHGFGFASVLADLNLPNSSLVLSLFGFNIGVEIGQLILVALVIPLAYLTRRSTAYPRFALRTGSVVIAAVSLGWLLERSLNLQLMPF
ncbi:MAG: HupE/UreJ family protein [Casimicrobium sp.]